MGDGEGACNEAVEISSGWGPLSALPGDAMMWILIISELAVFGAALAGYAVSRALDPELFSASQAHLDPFSGALNTAILLTSGAFAAGAVRQARAGAIRTTRWLIGIAFLFGLAFLTVKVGEYAGHLADGYGLEANTFFTLYYLVTGFHAAHVVFGLMILALVAAFASEENVTTGCAFWHMVDLVWVLVFAVFYLS
ncbi:cytochrome c oxidase subunit 3 family protein [Stappia sp. GBMRC 2046]|uniref:Cytochrome c oxidase subunit 3 family protein n=1 Tax=Stappia sediminis TaxID=2692190 RepID=A0A7X3LRV6_9HYPH|nr:cytochrome c oxidase subunit 3 [Stappia sediminis]MXN63954.1 cytochrome c oxidase subunit 3 family protein [Stappia sediminis]